MNDKIVNRLKLKAFADYKLKVIQKTKLFWIREKTLHMEKEENGYQHFVLIAQCFQKALSSASFKVGIV